VRARQLTRIGFRFGGSRPWRVGDSRPLSVEEQLPLHTLFFHCSQRAVRWQNCAPTVSISAQSGTQSGKTSKTLTDCVHLCMGWGIGKKVQVGEAQGGKDKRRKAAFGLPELRSVQPAIRLGNRCLPGNRVLLFCTHRLGRWAACGRACSGEQAGKSLLPHSTGLTASR
jgi:hypothetical protein